MVAINMCRCEFSGYTSDVVVSDRINGYRELAVRLRNEKVFANVFDLQLSTIYPQNSRSKAVINTLFLKKNILMKDYDVLLFANLNYDISCIYRLIKRKNSKVKAYMFEDGYASYSQYYADFFKIFQNRTVSLKKRLFHKCVDSVFKHIEKMYVFSPEFVTYQPSFQIEKLQNIDYRNPFVIKIYNRVFNYGQDNDLYRQKYIFFEESYFADGYSLNDIEIVEWIAEIVGKENIFIKIHPRNPINRFAELGYETNSNTSIPWEVIALNLQLKDKVLISIASVAVIVPTTMFGMDYTGILLMKLLKDDYFLKKDITCLYEDICERYDNLHVVKEEISLAELFNC